MPSEKEVGERTGKRARALQGGKIGFTETSNRGLKVPSIEERQMRHRDYIRSP